MRNIKKISVILISLTILSSCNSSSNEAQAKKINKPDITIAKQEVKQKANDMNEQDTADSKQSANASNYSEFCLQKVKEVVPADAQTPQMLEAAKSSCECQSEALKDAGLTNEDLNKLVKMTPETAQNQENAEIVQKAGTVLTSVETMSKCQPKQPK